MDIICPLCRHTLTESAKRWHCDNNHSFDIAKQGYTYLLPVQHKKSKSPGDDAAMVKARREFLEAGYYQAVADEINQFVVKQFKQTAKKQLNIIDAGCGEGYYTSVLSTALKQQHILADITGIDISKPACLTAAKRFKDIRWLVASSSSLPVANHQADLLISLFAPNQAAEFYRCLSAEGLLLIATTGSQHLIELRELLYDDVRNNVYDPALELKDHFVAASTHKVAFTIDLPNTQTIKNLFAMTPHVWRVSPERQKQLDGIKTLKVTVDILLHCFKPLNHHA